MGQVPVLFATLPALGPATSGPQAMTDPEVVQRLDELQRLDKQAIEGRWGYTDDRQVVGRDVMIAQFYGVSSDEEALASARFVAALVNAYRAGDFVSSEAALQRVRDGIRADADGHAVTYGAADQRFRDGLMHAWAKFLPVAALGVGVPTERPRQEGWDYTEHPGDCHPQSSDSVWTVCCRECAGTGVFPVPWIGSVAEGREQMESASCVSCKGTGRSTVGLAAPATCSRCGHPKSDHDTTGECCTDYCKCGWRLHSRGPLLPVPENPTTVYHAPTTETERREPGAKPCGDSWCRGQHTYNESTDGSYDICPGGPVTSEDPE